MGNSSSQSPSWSSSRSSSSSKASQSTSTAGATSTAEANAWLVTTALKQAAKTGRPASSFITGSSAQAELASELKRGSYPTSFYSEATVTEEKPEVTQIYEKAPVPVAATQQQKNAEQNALLVAQRGSPAQATALSAKYGYGTDYQAQYNARVQQLQAERASTGSRYNLTREEYLAVTRPQHGERMVETSEGEVLPESEFRRRAVGGTPSGYRPVVNESGLGVGYEFVRYNEDTPVQVGVGEPVGYEVEGGRAGAGVSVRADKLEEYMEKPVVNPVTGEVTRSTQVVKPVYASYETITFGEYKSRVQSEATASGYIASFNVSGQDLNVLLEPVEFSTSEFTALPAQAQESVRTLRYLEGAAPEQAEVYAGVLSRKATGVFGSPTAFGFTGADFKADSSAAAAMGYISRNTPKLYTVYLPDLTGDWAKGSVFTTTSKEEAEGKYASFELAFANAETERFETQELARLNRVEPWVKGFREFVGVNPLTGFTGYDQTTNVKFINQDAGGVSGSLSVVLPTGKAKGLVYSAGESTVKGFQDFFMVAEGARFGSQQYREQFSSDGFTPYVFKYPDKLIGFVATSSLVLGPALLSGGAGAGTLAAPTNAVFKAGRAIRGSATASGLVGGGALGGALSFVQGKDVSQGVAEGAVLGGAYGYVGGRLAKSAAASQTRVELAGIDDFARVSFAETESVTVKGYDLTLRRGIVNAADDFDDVVRVREVATLGKSTQAGLTGDLDARTTFTGYGEKGTTFSSRSTVKLAGEYTTLTGKKIPVSEVGVAMESGVITPNNIVGAKPLFSGADVSDDLYSYYSVGRYGRLTAKGEVLGLTRGKSAGVIQDLFVDQAAYPNFYADRAIKFTVGDYADDFTLETIQSLRRVNSRAPYGARVRFTAATDSALYARELRPVLAQRTSYAYSGVSGSGYDVVRLSSDAGLGRVLDLPEPLVKRVSLSAENPDIVNLGPQVSYTAPRTGKPMKPLHESVGSASGTVTQQVAITKNAPLAVVTTKTARSLTRGLLETGLTRGLTQRFKGIAGGVASFAGAFQPAKTAEQSPRMAALEQDSMELTQTKARVTTRRALSYEEPSVKGAQRYRLDVRSVERGVETPVSRILSRTLSREQTKTMERNQSKAMERVQPYTIERAATRLQTKTRSITEQAFKITLQPVTTVFPKPQPIKPPRYGGWLPKKGFKLEYNSNKRYGTKRSGKGYSRVLAPYADWLSKTQTELETKRVATSPTEATSRKYWFQSYGQRVPTAQALTKAKRIKVFGGKRK